MKKSISIFIIFALLLVLGSCKNGQKQIEYADYGYTNGKIYTANENQLWVEAIAVKGTDIVYVGNNEDVKAFIGDETHVTDLKGKMILPGLITTHDHPILFMGLANLSTGH